MKDELTRIAEALERIADKLTPAVQRPYIEPEIWSEWNPAQEKAAVELHPGLTGWLSPTASRGD